jgi:myo-inositol-1(or 4)-monophosphatase
MGSVAYKNALVAAGRADATWTLIPKHEWDVAAGASLIVASGGWIALPNGHAPAWNNANPLIDGSIATTGSAASDVGRFLISANPEIG